MSGDIDWKGDWTIKTYYHQGGFFTSEIYRGADTKEGKVGVNEMKNLPKKIILTMQNQEDKLRANNKSKLIKTITI